MSEYDDDDFDGNDSQDNGPAGLRKALKEEKAKAKKLADDFAALKEQFDTASKANRAAALKESLTAVGGDAASKVARFYPSDAEATPEAVKQWLDENKDVFNLSAASSESSDSSSEATPEAPVDPAIQTYLDARERAAALEQDRVESPGDEKLIAQMEEVGRTAKTQQQFAEGMAALGAPVSNSGYRR